jgi:colanic acid biosynthesis glycosyl transferase WcaI
MNGLHVREPSVKILALTHYFPPEVNAPASRMAEHARVWQRAGHEVTIVTCAPNHPAGTLYPGYRNHLWQEDMVDGIRVIRIWTYLAANDGFLPRIANYLSFFLSILLFMWRLPKSDVVLSTSPQFFCGMAGWLLKRRRRPWVLEIRDIWPESIVTVGAMKRGVAIRLLEWIEGFAYRKADLVVAVTDSFVSHIRARKPDGPIVVVKNGADLTRYVANAPAAEDFKTQHGLSGKFVASYVGTIGMAHGVETVLEAAELLQKRSDIAFIIVGDGAERARIQSLARERALNNVHILGQRPKEEMPAIWGASSAALVILRRQEMFKAVIPSKMFEAMALRVPIILGVEGEALTLMEQGGCGIAIIPEDSGDLARAVLQLADAPEQCALLGEAGERYVRQEFDRERLAIKLLDAMKAIAGQ